MTFRHNSTGVNPNATISMMPDGWYTMKIVSAEEQTSKKGNDMILVKCSPVNEPEYKEATLWHWVVFMPRGEKGDGISVHFRKCIGVAFGGDDIVDAEEWVGKKFAAYVSRELYKEKERNKIQMVKSLEEYATENGLPVPDKDDEVPF